MVDSDLLKEFKFSKEDFEESEGQWIPTGFPKSLKQYRMVYEVHDLSIEGTYFWILNYLTHDGNFTNIQKIEDSFAAAEGSAFFGVMQQRVGLQQDKISQFLATIGKMVKELFQLVRELRILDERLTYYNEANAQLEKPLSGRMKGSEITLKGMFIDLVQGGAKSAASVYGMSRELEFTTLPDLFFDAPPFKTPEELEQHVNELEFNAKVKEVLKRHLRQFFEWKKRTSKEMVTRRKFTLQYLRQHFDIIKMYMEWAKPYLRNVERLSPKEAHTLSPDLITAFEGSMLDIELLAMRPYGDYNACILATFHYRTRPSMKFVQEGYQRGPIHVGRLVMNLRAYVWTKEEAKRYKKMKDKESMELLKTISGSVKSAMDALGDELFDYLKEAGEEMEKKKEIKKPGKTITEKLFGDFMTPKEAKPEKKPKPPVLKGDFGGAKGHCTFHCFNIYKNFKKANGMVMW